MERRMVSGQVCELLDVLTSDYAVDGGVQLDALRAGKLAVRLLLADLRKDPDAEGPQVTYARCAANAEGV